VSEHVFVSISPNLKGNIAEAVIAAEATKLGIAVLRPQTEHTRYDLAFDMGGAIVRVQCKWARLQGPVVSVNLTTCRQTPNGAVYTKYSATEIDAVAAYCGDLGRCYLIPIEGIEKRRAIHLRLEPARNGQRACINLAAHYEFSGAVAQLARAPRWQRGGQGFESPQLHRAPRPSPVGAEQFGKHPARFVERAAAGEEFLITRRGRPMARLSPPEGDVPRDASP
jgi:hypothetical protein